MLYNGHGRHDAALAAAQRASEHHPSGAYPKALVELVEAAVRCGSPEAAATALDQLSDRDLGRRHRLGARRRGALARAPARRRAGGGRLQRGDRAARPHARPGGSRARALVYGEWLRRARRRLDARGHLRTAHEQFAAMGVGAFADRAARELQATGETARKRSIETADELTAQECQVARLARDGLSNPEIGARLFISPRTVQYHLRKVFGKLDISSRSQLETALPASRATPSPAGRSGTPATSTSRTACAAGERALDRHHELVLAVGQRDAPVAAPDRAVERQRRCQRHGAAEEVLDALRGT